MGAITNYLTIDVEDYFQVSAFEDMIDKNSWGTFECRVERNTDNLLESLEYHNIKGTFFIVGWIADNFPGIVNRIHALGHEVACHSYWHRKVNELSEEEFRKDTLRAKNALEKITGCPVVGYRAPSYSITNESLWALDVLEELGFSYDSSIFPIHHDKYGIPEAPRFSYTPKGKSLLEYPISTIDVFGQNFPVSGGGYFRLLPYTVIRAALKRINQVEKKPFVFYIHPWEIDTGQPRIKKGSTLSKFRHYVNISSTMSKFDRLLKDFNFGTLGSG